MGLKIFESTGTFNPADFGLKVGDTLYIICVGGGGGGSSGPSSSSPTNGGASSFGSYVTATGGNKASNYEPGALQANSIQGGRAWSNYITYGSNYNTIRSGGSGGDGWYPGIKERITAQPLSGQITDVFGHSWNTSSSTTYNSTSALRAFPGSGLGDSQLGGAGGLGYGGGGGGAFYSSSSNGAGGNSGQVIYSSVLLTSTSSISVTVGAGGKGGQYDSYYLGGAGAKGCVAVFW